MLTMHVNNTWEQYMLTIHGNNTWLLKSCGVYSCPPWDFLCLDMLMDKKVTSLRGLLDKSKRTLDAILKYKRMGGGRVSVG